jgi:hypothetical protein
MANGLPTKAKVGIPGKYVNISPATYFIAKRMESAGMLRPGQALQLAATLPNKAPKKGKRK